VNTADLCAEGRELYAVWIAWVNYDGSSWGGSRVVHTERAKAEAYQKYKQHLEECEICMRS